MIRVVIRVISVGGLVMVRIVVRMVPVGSLVMVLVMIRVVVRMIFLSRLLGHGQLGPGHAGIAIDRHRKRRQRHSQDRCGGDAGCGRHWPTLPYAAAGGRSKMLN